MLLSCLAMYPSSDIDAEAITFPMSASSVLIVLRFEDQIVYLNHELLNHELNNSSTSISGPRDRLSCGDARPRLGHP